MGWTKDKYYRDVNRALLADDYEQLQYWVWLSRGINMHISTGRCERVLTDTETWRGSKLNSSQFAELKEGVVYRGPLYLATSTNWAKAKQFSVQYMVKFNIPA